MKRLLILFSLLISNPLYAEFERVTVAGRTIEALPGHVLVKYKSDRANAAKAKMLQRFSVRSRKAISGIGVEVVPVPAGDTIQSFLEKLKNDPDVEFAEPNGVLRALVAPNDPLYASQFEFDTSHINVEAAWDITTGDTDVIVAVVDSGVDYTHTDLNSSMWTNPSPSGNSGVRGTTIEIDWNGDGDCVDSFSSVGDEQCASNDPADDFTGEFHGTRVSGIIAAETNNAQGMAGIARDCKVMAVKALNNIGAGSYSAIAEGIIYAADNGASVINLSLGGTSNDPSGAVQAAIRYAIYEKNAVVVAASGNSGNSVGVNFPASIEDVIAVGATNSNNTLASFSCTGNELDLVAPGVGITTTYPTNTNDTDDGTSFSAPMVSGVAALIRSIRPTMTAREITNYLNFTATDLGSAGFDTGYGFGMLNATRALQAVVNGTVFVTNPAEPGKSFTYPNPFSPGGGSVVQFSIPGNTGATTTNGIEITIYNSAGEEVKKLNNTIEWNGRNDDGDTVASGLYYYFVKSPGGEHKGKLTVIK